MRGSLATLLILFPAFLFLGPWRTAAASTWLRMLILLTCGVGSGLILPWPGAVRAARVAMALMAAGALFLLLQPFTAAKDFPFSLTWSEGNKLWDYSLYFWRAHYNVVGEWVIPNYVTPGLYGLQGLPYLIPGATISLLRAWDSSLLTYGALIMVAALFLRRPGAGDPVARLWLVLWGFLYLMQGPAFAPLTLAAAGLALLHRRGRPFWSAMVTAAAGFYLGISRWTWMIAAPLWSATWMLLGGPGAPAPRRGRWGKAMGQALAGLAGGGVSILYTRWIEGRSTLMYFGDVRHPLLWYRLLPNATSRLGLLPWIALVIAPLVLLLLWAWAVRWLRWDREAVNAVVLAALGLLGIGLTVSVKIGGGNNLHNLDMLLVYLVVLAERAAAALRARAPWGDILRPAGVRAVVGALVLVPCLSVATRGLPARTPPEATVETYLRQFRETVLRAAEDGPVLFIDQRQMLTFGFVPGVDLVPEYELVELMDRAMAPDPAYLQRFYDDLQAHRFSLIVSDPLPIVWKGRAYSFGEENDAWVQHVTVPILTWYQPVVTLDEVQVWLLAPIESGGAP